MPVLGQCCIWGRASSQISKLHYISLKFSKFVKAQYAYCIYLNVIKLRIPIYKPFGFFWASLLSIPYIFSIFIVIFLWQKYI